MIIHYGEKQNRAIIDINDIVAVMIDEKYITMKNGDQFRKIPEDEIQKLTEIVENKKLGDVKL